MLLSEGLIGSGVFGSLIVICEPSLVVFHFRTHFQSYIQSKCLNLLTFEGALKESTITFIIWINS